MAGDRGRHAVTFHDVEMMVRVARPRIDQAADRLRQRRCGRPLARALASPLAPLPAARQREELRRRVHSRQPHEQLLAPPAPAEDERHLPARGQGAEDVLERVHRAHRAARERHDLVVVPQPAPPGVGRLEDVRDHHLAVGAGGDDRAERGVVHDPAGPQAAEEIPQLVGGDGVAGADIDPPALLERGPAVDADQPARGVEQAAAGVAGIDRGVHLDAVGVFEDRAGRKLVAVDARDDADADRRAEIGRQQEGIAGGEAGVAHGHGVAVGEHGMGEVVASDEFHEGHVAGRIEAHEHGVVEPAVVQPAAEHRAGGLGDVEVGQRVAVGADEDARSAPRRAGEDRDHRGRRPTDDLDAVRLRLEHGGIDVAADDPRGGERERQGGQAAADRQPPGCGPEDHAETSCRGRHRSTVTVRSGVR